MFIFPHERRAESPAAAGRAASVHADGTVTRRLLARHRRAARGHGTSRRNRPGRLVHGTHTRRRGARGWPARTQARARSGFSPTPTASLAVRWTPRADENRTVTTEAPGSPGGPSDRETPRLLRRPAGFPCQPPLLNGRELVPLLAKIRLLYVDPVWTFFRVEADGIPGWTAHPALASRGSAVYGRPSA